MSNLEKMIKELCPKGVEYVKLLSVADVLYGYPCDASKFNTDGVGTPLARIRDVREGKTDTYTTESVPNKYTLKRGDLLVGMDGNFHVANWKMDGGILCQRVCKFNSNDNEKTVLNGFLSHLLKPIIKKIEDDKPNGTVKHLLDKDIKAITIPLPPLPIQKEIVSILDKFTTLEAELEAELDCRKRQYEYYRNKLLTFNKLVGGGTRRISWMTMNDLGYFYGGLSGKSKNDFDNGDAKYITYMNVYSNISVNLDAAEKVNVSENEKQNTIQYGDILFTGSSETRDECGMTAVVTDIVKEPIYLNSFCFGFRMNDNSQFNVHFLKHLFRGQALRDQIIKTASGVTRFNVSKKKMLKVIIPIPPIEEQNKIADILDRFETLTNDLQSGLPAEIEARRKQYEYYREKLLTFEHKAA